MQRLIVLLITVFSCACHPVYSVQPVGEKPRDLSTEIDQWEGTWGHGDGALTVAVTDARRGALKVGWFEKSGNTLKPQVFDIELRTFGKWTFANVKDPEKPRYMLARLEKDDRRC